jgi:phosphatidylserine/phosphatidylglycerophosphate/cardiolipin synthase-like enzyme
MRVTKSEGDFSVKAIAGTRAGLIALNCVEARRHGLLGFAFERETAGVADPDSRFLRSGKVFKSVVPDPSKATDPSDPTKPALFRTDKHPIQSFLWSDYTAEPDTAYRFTVTPMYGSPKALEPKPGLSFEIRTEKELDKGHGIWFNRGAVASQEFARRFKNRAPTEAEQNDPNAEVTRWLSRGLLDACLNYIHQTPPGDALRVAAYEFTYKPVLDALKAALDRGVDVQIVYKDTTKEKSPEKGANEKAIALSALPKTKNGVQVLFPRTKAKIPHNKFIVRLGGGTVPTMVWTGSTNFTPSGFLGQANVGHQVVDGTTAEQYHEYWKLLTGDPDRDTARIGAMNLTKHPPALVGEASISRVFSPRTKSALLKWYGDRIDDATGGVMFTAAFGVTEQLVRPLAADRDFLRFILMEKPPTDAVNATLTADRDLVISFGAVLGEMYRFKNGEPVAREKIKEFELEKWLLKEDHFRRSGFVFFVHTKFLMIDPLSDDPLVCSGSANFSPPSLLENDENMLLIRGDTRVAGIFMTEFDRLFRHFYFRDIANKIEADGGTAEGVFLDESSNWTRSYFTPGGFKTRRREMFFADTSKSWVENAKKRPIKTVVG